MPVARTIACDTVGAMFLDWYMRFRGIDEWPTTLGTVLNVVLMPGIDGGDGKSPDRKKVHFQYEDGDSLRHEGAVVTEDGTELFHVDEGDEFKLLYYPKRPNKFFVPGAHHDSDLQTFFIFGIIAVVSLGSISILIKELIRFFARK